MLINDVNDDELQSYSTQIVPPQDLFGLEDLGQYERWHLTAIQVGGALLLGTLMGYMSYRTLTKNEKLLSANHFLVKNKVALALTSGAVSAGIFFAISASFKK